ncbi:zinc finger SWIM domain-containing protein 3 [Lissotriton helveticus]
MEVGNCFRDYDDFKESFGSFKKESKCQYGLRNCVTVRYYNRKNGTYIRDEITFTHVKYICVEPQSNNKKKKQLSNGCPAYLVLEYSEELDRLVIKEQNSNHVHLGLKDSPKLNEATSKVRKISHQLHSSSPRKLPIQRLRQRTPVKHCLIKKRNRIGIHAGLGVLQTRKRSTTANEESTSRRNSTFSQKSTKRKLLPKDPVDPLPIKELKCNSTYEDLGDNLFESSIFSSIQERSPGPVDNQVNKEHNSIHAPIDQKESLNGSASSPLWDCALGPDKSPPQRLLRKRNGQNLCLETTCIEQKVKLLPSGNRPASPVESNTVSLSSKEKVSSFSLERVTNGVKELLRIDSGSLASFSTDTMENLDMLSFQTSKMCALFTKFPESLLLHRVHSKCGYILYAFLVESKERVGKVVHFAVLKEETAESMSKMLNVFAQFNPEYWKVKVIFTDATFAHKSTLQEIFPASQVLLSVYHTVQLIEKKVRALSGFREYLEITLRDVVFSPSNENRQSLSRMLKQLLDPQFHQFIETHWISCEMLWYMHVKKGLHSCSTYMDSLQMITHKITSVYSKQSSLENSILYIVEYADCFNSRGLENFNQGSLYSTKLIHRNLVPKKVGRKPKDSSTTKSSPSPDVLPPKSSTRISSLPSPSVLLPKLAQLLPKSASSMSRPEQPLQPKSQTSAQPEPEYTLQPEQDSPMLAESEPTVLVKQEPVLPETNSLQPKRESPLLEPLLPKTEPLLSESEGLLPKLEPSLRQWDPFLPESSSLLPKSEPLPQPEPLLPKLEPLLNDWDPLLGKFLSKPEPRLPQQELMPPEWEPLHPRQEPLLPEQESMQLKLDTQLPEPECHQPKLLHSPVPSHFPHQQLLRDDDSVLNALKETCTEVAYQLCLSEWEVVKTSSRIIKMFEAATSVKLVEDIHEVSRDCQTCSCYFNKRYRLPCRHILTILHVHNRPVEDDMVCPRWQRKYQHPTLADQDILGHIRCSAINQKAGEARFSKIKSLSKELENLLMQCEGPELKERCSTLHSILAMWKKSQKPVENGVAVEEEEEKKMNNLGELPLLWRIQDYGKVG